MLLLWYGRKYYGRTFPSLVFQVRGDSFRTSLSTARWTRGYRWTWIPGMSNTVVILLVTTLVSDKRARRVKCFVKATHNSPTSTFGEILHFYWERSIWTWRSRLSSLRPSRVRRVTLQTLTKNERHMRKIRPWKRRISFTTHLAKRCRCNGRSCSELTLRTLDSLQETFCQQRVYLFV